MVHWWVLVHCDQLPITSVNPVHNAQVCYFNNVWLMFLVFLKNFYGLGNKHAKAGYQT